MNENVLSNTGARIDLEIRQGATFTHVLTFTDDETDVPTNITGRTYAAQVRRDSTLITTFVCVVTNGAAGQMSITLTPTETALISNVSNLRWDLEETNGAAVNAILYGTVKVITQVTT